MPDRLVQTRNDSLIGTPLYMAPEQARGENKWLDERTDLYSLSVLFYEFLTLRHPLGSPKTLREVLESIKEQKPKLAMLVRHPHQPPVPADLSHVLAKGLKKQPDERFVNISELRRRLQMVRNCIRTASACLSIRPGSGTCL